MVLGYPLRLLRSVAKDGSHAFAFAVAVAVAVDG